MLASSLLDPIVSHTGWPPPVEHGGGNWRASFGRHVPPKKSSAHNMVLSVIKWYSSTTSPARQLLTSRSAPLHPPPPVSKASKLTYVIVLLKVVCSLKSRLKLFPCPLHTKAPPVLIPLACSSSAVTRINLYVRPSPSATLDRREQTLRYLNVALGADSYKMEQEGRH